VQLQQNPVKPSAHHVATRHAVNHELFLLGYKNLPVTGVGHSLLSILTVWAAAGTVGNTTLTWWLGYMLTIGALYGFEHWNFRAYARGDISGPHELQRWRMHRQTLQFFSAAGWGGLGFLLVPGAEMHNIVIMTAFTGMVGYSAASNTANDVRGFAVSALASSGILVSQLATAFGREAAALSIMTILYSAVLTVVVKNTSATMRETIRLRMSNQALAAENARQAALAERANRDKSEFLAAASHDLRQPVHALLLLIEAYRQGDPKAASHPLVRQIAAAGQSINGLFSALMELSRLESGTEKPSPVPIKLRAAMQAAIDNIRPQGDQKKLVLRTFVSKALAQTTVYTDKVLLERILGNLLSNAIRYTSHGGVLLALRKAHGSDGLWLEVWDTGMGIAQVDQKRIFDPYVQIGNRERDRSKGLGLGLAIVRHAAELLGMGVSLYSRVGHGSRFRLYIPPSLIQEETEASMPAALSDFVRQPGAVLAGRRILLIDDDPMVLQAMQALLGEWQMDLRCNGGADDSVLVQCDPDWTPECIVSDFRLPGPHNGIALLDALLERYPNAVGILQTGEMARDVYTQAEEAGYLVLSKPVPPQTLASTLSAVLERRSVERLP